jgi:pyruvate/2-oxoglutarate dehydrogenase complex dihydrolipoamide acyltransferase (E2) component
MRKRTLVIGSVVLSGAALLLFCCGGSQREASAPSTESAAQASSEPPVAAAAPASAPAPVESSAVSPDSAVPPESAPSASAPASTGAGSRIAQAVSASDPRDMKLLAGIERELKLDPPPEVHALIAARKRGAGRDELARGIQRVSDMRMRALSFRWLDEVAPAGDAGTR